MKTKTINGPSKGSNRPIRQNPYLLLSTNTDKKLVLSLNYINFNDLLKHQLDSLKEASSKAEVVDLFYSKLGHLSAEKRERLGEISFPNATEVSLYANKLGSSSGEVIKVLGGAFPKANKVNLAHNNLGALPAEAITALGKAFPNATKVNLSKNNLGELSVAAIAALGKAFPHVTRLNLFYNSLNLLSFEKIAALKQAFPRVIKVNLSLNNLDSLGAEEIATLGKAFPSATHVNLSHNNLGYLFIQEIKVLGDAFSKATEINLSNNKLDNLSSIKITALAKTFSNVTRIDLSCNNLKEKTETFLRSFSDTTVDMNVANNNSVISPEFLEILIRESLLSKVKLEKNFTNQKIRQQLNKFQQQRSPPLQKSGLISFFKTLRSNVDANTSEMPKPLIDLMLEFVPPIEITFD